ncbi:MAG: ABC transporter permease [Candidatus Woesearchaeota archaeon]|jgi:putative ABC transport system permease protein
MILDYLKIAFKSLAKRKVRSYLTMLGIIIGIAAVVSLISLGQGLEHAVVHQFQAAGADRINVQAKGLGNGPPGANVAVPLTSDDLRAVNNAQGVEIATGRLIRSVKIEFKDRSRFAYLASLPNNVEERNFIDSSANYEMEEGRALKPGEKYKVVLGNNYIAKPLFERELKVGDTIQVQGRDFQIVGFLKNAGSFQVDGTIIMNEDIAREILDEPDVYDIIVAAATDSKKTDFVANNVYAALLKERDVKEGKENFTVETSQQTLASLKKILSFVTYFLVAIAGISIVVGGVGITNTMYTSVMERTREIGIMKAIGARNSDILSIFLFEAGLIGLVGGIIGILFGIGLAKLVEIIGRQALGSTLITASFSFSLIFGSLLFAFLLGAIAGVTPALRAAKMSPVDALRKN